MHSSPRALISVYDKTGIIEFANGLHNLGWEIISTGGTSKKLKEAGIPVLDVSEVTGHPEIFDGRVKTLHPAIHGSILARIENENDVKGLDELGYKPIKLVAVNLYPFAESASIKPPLSDLDLLEMVDIGGPTLLRASAKNYHNVLSISNPDKYTEIIELLNQNEGSPLKLSKEYRRKLALETFEHTASYDVAISKELHKRWIGEANKSEELNQAITKLPNRFLIDSQIKEIMRYGENPHQAAAFYENQSESEINLSNFLMHSGKPLSYNNYIDLDSALRLARNLSTDDWPDTPYACVIVKHNNPCGAALSDSQKQSWIDALASDPESAFGCIVAFNTKVEVSTAKQIGEHFVECIIAPSFEPDALKILAKKRNRRLLSIKKEMSRLTPHTSQIVAKQVNGGWLLQTEQSPKIDPKISKIVTKVKPSKDEISAMKFGIVVCEQVKSNSVIFVKGTKTVGIGPGQTSRVEAVRIAARRAGSDAEGAVMVSDAFFPFRDGIDAAHEIGITSIVQPGGSIRDEEVINAANQHQMSMLFTGVRLFRH
ncbi:MAG: bifunctional phosphoribosylaminoimidazolecarboxamide formyltransferase/inosine monophosphate cyclohydrolase [Methanobacteriota archaeon]|nr:MAG: bifunctional phosphoribosylaminoimidazolecarboxamide formyltransferase/inosine monophosphate cyclohydrolase [Euryarchaeota archaeon]|tara:strand:- start:4744 stop:6372 length:1629 start_codon:yes stop_codon:yes gene_type:complete